MADLLYVQASGSIPKFLRHIQQAGVPGKLTMQYLLGAGFKSSNERGLIGMMRAVGFTDASNVPTDRWKAYRNTSKAKAVLGEGIRDGYAGLYGMYPDAHERSTEAIRNYFSTQAPSIGARALQMAVATFKALASEAVFTDSRDERAPSSADALPVANAPTVPVASRPVAAPSAFAQIAVNIELHLPATDDAEVYEKLFAAMRKHLIDRS